MTHLTVGDKAPSFTSLDQNGETISLEQFRGKKLILFFYPKDDSPGCTKEACSLRDGYKKLRKMGFEILGVSPDKPAKHKKFIDKYEFQFSLAADTEKEIINAYGLWGPKKFMGREVIGVHRTTFIIDEEGLIQHIITKVKTKDHADQIVEAFSTAEAA
ncbi:MAG: thioredoxin-dependent thiol peroxidase [Bacteroidota bacterium]